MELSKLFTRFPFISQHDSMDCGPACLAMISAHYGKKIPLQYLRDNSYLTKEGVSLIGLSSAAKSIDLNAIGLRMTAEMLQEKEMTPSILFWDNCHFVVLYKIQKSFINKQNYYHIADPSAGFFKLSTKELVKRWCDNEQVGVVLGISPTREFYARKTAPPKPRTISFILNYITPYYKTIIKLFSCLACGSVLTLILPFLTQALVDNGINSGKIHIVFFILLAQIMVFLGSTVIELVRNWIVLYMGSCINVSIINDFFFKLVKLPIGFFETKFLGDFYQRIQDHARIEHFLTSQSMTTFFSLINFLIFFCVLFSYSGTILLVYLSLTSMAVAWSLFFLRKREIIDYQRFRNNSFNQEIISEIIHGIQDIKLNNLEAYKITRWREIQNNIFLVNLKSMNIDQIQVIGFNIINQLKNLIVTFLAAQAVINDKITIGGMLSISYIIGQMNSPVNQLVSFFRSFQDAHLSIQRLSEVQHLKDEESAHQVSISNRLDTLNREIKIKDVSFQYEGPLSNYVLNKINISICEGQTTAIVGASGSGKTTLMKLMLMFYSPTNGEITIEGKNTNSISPHLWRKDIGVVMQDGYIFSDTIEQNIICGAEEVDEKKLSDIMSVCNLSEYVESLPRKEKTRIGAMGIGLSGGEKQRILIARAIYNQPKYLFFDEATSSLDTKNEKTLHENLRKVFKGKTVVIIAHRLSTVKNADKIIVLDKGQVVESGTHHTLIESRGKYFELVKNQLELDKS